MLSWTLAMLLILQKAAMAADDEFLLLRSEGYNSLSQYDIIDLHTYETFDTLKGGSLIDFEIDVTKTSLTTFSPYFDTIKMRSRGFLEMKSFFSGKQQKRRLVIVMNETTMQIINFFQRDSGDSSVLFELSVSSQVPAIRNLNCTAQTDKVASNCTFISVCHKAMTTEETFLIELQGVQTGKAGQPQEGSKSLHIIFLRLASQEGGFFKEQDISIYPLDLMESCAKTSILLIGSPLNSLKQGLYFVRYCPAKAAPGSEPPPSCLKFYFLEPQEERSYLLKGPREVCRYEYLNHLSTITEHFSTIRVVNNEPFVIVANTNNILYITMKQLYETIKNETQVPRLKLIHLEPIADIFCTSINIEELSCTLVNPKSNPNEEEYYSILELVNFEGNSLSAINVPISIWSNSSLVDSINSKNYISFKFEDSFYLCTKKTNLEQVIPEGFKNMSEVEKYEQCSKRDFEEGRLVKEIRPFIFEENYSNLINGYLLVAVSDLKSKNSFDIRPLLITSPYFIFKLKTSTEKSSCNRYLPSCASSQIIFKDPKRENGPSVKKTIYVVDNKFNSVLKRSPSKKIETYISNGNLQFSLDEYFIGDIQNPKISFLPGIGESIESVASTENDFYAEVKRSFTYQFQNVLHKRYCKKEDFLGITWGFINFHSDKTFTFALSLHTKYQIPGLNLTRQVILKSYPTLDLTFESNNLSTFVPVEHVAYNTDKLVFSQHSNQKDSLDTLIWKVTGIKLELSIIRMIGKEKPQNIPIGSFDLEPNEQVQTLITSLDTISDNFAVISDQAVHVFMMSNQIAKKLNRFSIAGLLIEREFDSWSVNDILLMKNIMLLDVSLRSPGKDKASPPQVLRRVYIHNVDTKRDYFYCYGFIELGASARPGTHKVFYSKNTDKAVVIDYQSRTIVEYSLDNVFLDMWKVGTKLDEDCRLSLDTYGNTQVENFIGFEKGYFNASARTFGVAYNDMFLVGLKLRDKPSKEKKSIIVLLGQIDKVPLSVFKSSRIELEGEEYLFIPEMMQAVENSLFPLFVLSLAKGSFSIHFLWTEHKLGLHYKHIAFGAFGNRDERQESSIDLKLEFEDSSKRKYEEVVSVRREKRFFYLPKEGDLVAEGDKVILPIKSSGMITSMGLQCTGSYTVERISRNLTRYIHCLSSGFNVSLQNSINRDCSLDMNKSQWKDTIDLFHLDPEARYFKGIFVLLETRNLIFFKSFNNNLKQSLTIKCLTVDLASCLIIKSAELDEALVTTSIFCTRNSSLVEHVFQFDTALLRETEAKNSTRMLELAPSFTFRVPDRIWKSISLGKRNMKTYDELVFVRNEITLTSIGSKSVLDFYHVSPLDHLQKEASVERYELVNSTLNDKYGEFDLVNFRIFKSNDCSDRSVCKYKFFQLNSRPATNELRLSYGDICYQRPRDVNYSTILNLELVDVPEFGFSPKRVVFGDVHRFHTEVHAGIQESTYLIFIVCNNYVYEFQVEEVVWPSGDPREPTVEMSKQLSDSGLTKIYNYAGLCEPNSDFSFSVTSSHFTMNCLPKNTESLNMYVVIYAREHRATSLEIVNPSHTLFQFTGYSSSNSHMVLYRGEDNMTRIIKTSPRNLIDQFVLYNHSRLVFYLDHRDSREKQFTALFSNNYENKNITINPRLSKWRLFLAFTRDYHSEHWFFALVALYLLLLTLLLCAPGRRPKSGKPAHSLFLKLPGSRLGPEDGAGLLSEPEQRQALAAEMLTEIYG